MTSDIERARRNRSRADHRSARRLYLSRFQVGVSLGAPGDLFGLAWWMLMSMVPLGLLMFAICIARLVSKLFNSKSSDGGDDDDDDDPNRDAA